MPRRCSERFCHAERRRVSSSEPFITSSRFRRHAIFPRHFTPPTRHLLHYAISIFSFSSLPLSSPSFHFAVYSLSFSFCYIILLSDIYHAAHSSMLLTPLRFHSFAFQSIAAFFHAIISRLVSPFIDYAHCLCSFRLPPLPLLTSADYIFHACRCPCHFLTPSFIPPRPRWRRKQPRPLIYPFHTFIH